MKRQFDRWIATSALLLAGACGTPGAQSAMAGGMSTPPAAGAKPPTAAGGTTGGGAAGSTTTTPMAGSSGGDMMKCGTSTMPGPMLHQAAMMAIVASPSSKLPCAFSSCHDNNQKKAMLNLDVGTTDLKAAMVGKPSCEAPTISLVDGSGGDAALAKSWLWLKLAAPIDAQTNLTPDPAWGAGTASCGQDTGMGFGVRMPKSGGADGLNPTRLGAVRDWICAGAPGPM